MLPVLVLTRFNSVPENCSGVVHAYSDGAFGYVVNISGNYTYFDKIEGLFLCSGRWRNTAETDTKTAVDIGGVFLCMFGGVLLAIVISGSLPLITLIVNKLSGVIRGQQEMHVELADMHEGVDNIEQKQDIIIKYIKKSNEPNIIEKALGLRASEDGGIEAELEDMNAASKERTERRKEQKEAQKLRVAALKESEKNSRFIAMYVWVGVVTFLSVVAGTFTCDHLFTGLGWRHFTKDAPVGYCVAVDTSYAQFTEDEVRAITRMLPNSTLSPRRVLSQGGKFDPNKIMSSYRTGHVLNENNTVTFTTGCGASFYSPSNSGVTWVITPPHNHTCKAVRALEYVDMKKVYRQRCRCDWVDMDKIRTLSYPDSMWLQTDRKCSDSNTCIDGYLCRKTLLSWRINKWSDNGKWYNCNATKQAVTITRIDKDGSTTDVTDKLVSEFYIDDLAKAGPYYIEDESVYYTPGHQYNGPTSKVWLDPQKEYYDDPHEWVKSHLYPSTDPYYIPTQPNPLIPAANLECRMMYTIKDASDWLEFSSPCSSISIAHDPNTKNLLISTSDMYRCSFIIGNNRKEEATQMVSRSSPLSFGPSFDRVRCILKEDGVYTNCSAQTNWTMIVDESNNYKVKNMTNRDELIDLGVGLRPLDNGPKGILDVPEVDTSFDLFDDIGTTLIHTGVAIAAVVIVGVVIFISVRFCSCCSCCGCGNRFDMREIQEMIMQQMLMQRAVGSA